MKELRVGLGFDVHRFSKKKKNLIIGGVNIPYQYGLDAVSDGDVILHAMSDALCGAAGQGDIGDHFPPSEKSLMGIDSRKIVEHVLKITEKFKIINFDIIIIADKPRLSAYKQNILKSLQHIFCASAINVKIKSKEMLNILGGSNSIACLATVLVKEV